MLRLESVTKVFSHNGREITGVREVDFALEPGEFVTVVGPSGSGKSTLLLLMGGMAHPTRGRVLLEGESLYDLPPDRRAELRRDRIGFLFQTFNLVTYLTALENVQVPLYLSGLAPGEQERRARGLLEQVGLADRVDHKPAELSVGQRQRVALARMLANDPSLVLADEPTGNLDPAAGGDVIDRLAALHDEGRTVVMVTHDPAAAARGTRRLRLEDGRLAAAP